MAEARHGGPGNELSDWQKTEASVSADATNLDAFKADDPKTNGAKPHEPKGAQTSTDTSLSTSREALEPSGSARGPIGAWS
jgi:hypothetical protein